MNRAEAGKLGYIKSKEKIQRFLDEKSEEAKRNYEENKSYCKYCGELIPFEKRGNKFCSQSHAASYNNRGVQRNFSIEKSTGLIREKPKCLFCGKELNTYEKKYCNIKCHKDFEWKTKCDKVEKDGGFLDKTEMSQSRVPKRYLKEKRGHKCEICGETVWMGKQIPLVLDHIDGNAGNWLLTNLRLVCGNCDMQLPTYKSKNKSGGRFYRRKRMQEGKSY